ncbi:Non-heme 11 kDa protein of cytochrome bc1 complex [Hyaloscypha variabilis F]|uniref:Cytochrome b-c1 complex subunit 6, mitochondrial n=1 Tax=Hyaloscypha variabilis (strain UAMH 11265 / GT02V1 / F) TaxID=1149755 RepID=A0A2J6S645_HYAVF|nr:Non-heme 11 kDa protein of cytochrome bc1 complex [Hyaloscypha variabilis F]
MGFFDSISDMLEAALPWSTAEAEAPKEEETKDEESSDKSEEEGSEEKEEEPEEEEEEEEELEDPKEKFEEECKESKACAPAKHHFDECVERVTSADHGKPVDKKHPDEDCVEEFFHLAHCASTCAAPKLWNALK